MDISNEEMFTATYGPNTSMNWNSDQEINKLFLRSVQNYVNDRLKTRGVIFLNDVLVELGMVRTRKGQIVGWHISDGNTVIEFNPGEPDDEGAILLDFNVGGVVLDKLD